jgi:hypothetical protein
MKKTILALAMIAAIGSAAAQTSVNLGYQKQSRDDGVGPDQAQYSLGVKQKVTDLLSVDVGINAAQNDYSATASKSFKDTTRVEIGGTVQKAVFGPVDAYGRLGLGYKAPSGTEMFGYHSEEIGLVYHAPYGIHAKVGYRWRSAIDTNVAAGRTDTSETTRLALTYDINKTSSIALNRDNVRQDASNGYDQTAYNVVYTVKF